MVVQHALSFDVEHWFDGNFLRPSMRRARADENRLHWETDDALQLLAHFNVKATFFILGRLAVSRPEIVRTISGQGHEVACHSFDHIMLQHLDPIRYRHDLKKARAKLQDVSGQKVAGHRAPSWSLNRAVPWAVAAIAEAGFQYDSSIFPFRTALYGEPNAPPQPHWLIGAEGHRLLELPPATARWGALSIPYGGGFYWRVLPLWIVKILLAAAPTAQVTYLHPWELNGARLPAALDATLTERFVLRYGVGKVRHKLFRLLGRFSFRPLQSLVAELDKTQLPCFYLGGDHACRQSSVS